MRRAEALAALLDTRFRVPGTSFRFGLDPIISALPVAGDTVAAAIGMYMVREAILHRLGWRVVMRMLRNIGINWLIGLVPVIGILPDAMFKSNARNARLLRDAMETKYGPLEVDAA